MGRKLGTYSRLFWWTLIFFGICYGSWVGFSLAHNADTVPFAIFATLGGALFGAILGVYMGALVLGVGIIDNERQARVIALSMWGTTAIVVFVGAAIEIVAVGTIGFVPLEALLGLVFGAEIGAAVYNPKKPQQCQDGVV